MNNSAMKYSCVLLRVAWLFCCNFSLELFLLTKSSKTVNIDNILLKCLIFNCSCLVKLHSWLCLSFKYKNYVLFLPQYIYIYVGYIKINPPKWLVGVTKWPNDPPLLKSTRIWRVLMSSPVFISLFCFVDLWMQLLWTINCELLF